MADRLSASYVSRLNQCPGSFDLTKSIPGFQYPEENDEGQKGFGRLMHDIMAQIASNTTPGQLEKLIEALNFLLDLRRKRRFKMLVEETREALWLNTRSRTTPDLVLYLQDELHVVDWKWGNIEVEVVDNEQLMFYAVTCLDLAPKAKAVHLHIAQPFANGVSSWEVTLPELDAFVKRTQHTEDLIDAGSTTLVPSDHCLFCPAYPHSRGDKGTVMCPVTMNMLYPMAVDEAAILNE